MVKKFQFLAKKSRFRTFLQETFEVKILKRHTTLATNKILLEIGCGKGTGTRLIKKYFKPEKVYGVDVDAEVIEKAKKKTKSPNIIFSAGDAAKLPYKDKMFDAVFDFGVIYHITDWKQCLREIERVLKPEGQLIFEELSLDALNKSWAKTLRNFFDRPYKITYRRKEFLAFLEKEGWQVATKKILHPLMIEYFIVVAKRP